MMVSYFPRLSLPLGRHDNRWHSWLIIAMVVTLPRLAAATEPNHWNQWRGPQRTGEVVGDTWPERLDGNHLTTQWSVSLGPSYSGPVVQGEYVFTTETIDQERERVTAMQRATGEKLWTREWAGAIKVPFFAASRGSWIRATPVCDETTLYVPGIRDVLVALAIGDGSIRWQVNFVELFKTPEPAFGFVSSPLIDGDHLYVQAGASLVKLDKQTGAVIWRVLADDGGMMGSAFSSPVVATLSGERQLIVQTRESLVGVALTDGKTLWSQVVPAFRGMNILTPTVWNDHLFTSSYGGKSWAYAIRRTEGGSDYQVETSWENKVQGYMSSPIVIDQHLYLHLRNRRFTCIDLATGKERWITKPFGEYWSMIRQGERILALDEQGELLLIRANPASFELIDRRQVSDESCWAHLAYDRDQLFVRSLQQLTAYRWTSAGPTR